MKQEAHKLPGVVWGGVVVVCRGGREVGMAGRAMAKTWLAALGKEAACAIVSITVFEVERGLIAPKYPIPEVGGHLRGKINA